MTQQEQIYTDLKQGIIKGLWPENSKLPSENQLSEQYKTTRMTIRLSLARLVAEGYITRKNGIGSIVCQKRNTLGILTFKGLSEVAATEGRVIKTIELSPKKIINWPSDFFYPLPDTIQSQQCIILERLRKVEDINVLLEYTFLPADSVRLILTEQLIDGSLFKTLKQRYFIEVTGVQQDMKAVLADDLIAKHLHIHAGEPVIQIYRQYTTSMPGFFIYSHLTGNTKEFFLSNQFNQ